MMTQEAYTSVCELNQSDKIIKLNSVIANTLNRIGFASSHTTIAEG